MCAKFNKGPLLFSAPLRMRSMPVHVCYGREVPVIACNVRKVYERYGRVPVLGRVVSYCPKMASLEIIFMLIKFMSSTVSSYVHFLDFVLLVLASLAALLSFTSSTVGTRFRLKSRMFILISMEELA